MYQEFSFTSLFVLPILTNGQSNLNPDAVWDMVADDRNRSRWP